MSTLGQGLRGRSIKPEERLAQLLMARVWKRVVAWVLDQLFLSGIVVLPLSIFGGLSLAQLTQVLMLFTLFYFTLLEGATGKSLGKHLMKIKVYQEKGGEAGFARAMLRRVGLITPFISLIDALAIFWTPRRQRIFDLVAGTVVVEESRAQEALAYLKGKGVKALVHEMVAPAIEAESKRLRAMLEGLKRAREELRGRELTKDKYRELKVKYDARIQELEERLKVLLQRKSRRG